MTTTIVSCDSAASVGQFSAVKQRQQAMWASGDYAVIGATLQIVGESLAEAADVRSVDRVLDVAAGTGNATLAAARRFADVTSTDYVADLLERGRQRVAADGFTNVTFQTADVEALPFADGSFDVVLSTYGVMFAPDHARSSAELLRVCRTGGRIGLANWTPTGFIGQLLKTVGRYVPPPPEVKPASLWGTTEHIATLFAGAAAIRHAPRTFAFRYRSPEHWLEVFRTFYGPVHKAFLALDAERQTALETDILALLRSFDQGGGHGLVVPSEYLETVITK